MAAPNLTSREKTASRPFKPNGIYYGIVTRVDTSMKRVWVMVPRFANNFQFGPLNVSSAALPTINDRVACMFVEDRQDDIVVLGTIKNSASLDHVIPITATSATLPTDVPEGTLAYATDTENVTVWTGSAWTSISAGASFSPMTLDTVNNRVGINNPTPTVTLDVTGDIKSSGGITGASLAVSGSANTGSVTASGDVAVNGGDLTSTAATFNLLNQPTTLTIGSAATVLNLGASSGVGTTAIKNSASVAGDLTITGNLIGGTVLNEQTDSYSLLSSDNGKTVTLNKSTVVNLTVPSGLGLTAGHRIDIIQLGAGQVTVVASGTTVNGTPGLKLRAQYSAASLLCVGTNSYVLIGDLAS